MEAPFQLTGLTVVVVTPVCSTVVGHGVGVYMAVAGWSGDAGDVERGEGSSAPCPGGPPLVVRRRR